MNIDPSKPICTGMVTRCPHYEVNLVNRYLSGLFFVFASSIHLNWGYCLIRSDSPVNITGIFALSHIIGNHVYLGAFFLSVGVMALLGSFRFHGSRIGLLLTVPQQFALIYSAGGALTAIINGAFADGVKRNPMFLMADQGHYISTAVIHTYAVWIVYVKGGWLNLYRSVLRKAKRLNK